jgi:hypothetical protein
MDSGKLPHREVGTHRRVRKDALSNYWRASEAKRERALVELAEDTRRLGLEDSGKRPMLLDTRPYPIRAAGGG